MRQTPTNISRFQSRSREDGDAGACPEGQAPLASQRGRDLFDLETLDDVAHLQVIEALKTYTTLVAVGGLADVVLEATQGGEVAGPDDDPLADEPTLRRAKELALEDHD